MKLANLLLTTTLILLAGVAFGGFSFPGPVEVDLDNRQAHGSQLGATVSNNDIELIGCGIRAFDDGVNPPFSFGFCQANNSEDVFVVCFTESAELLDAIKGTSAYSFIAFRWDENFDCVRVAFSTQSFYLPAEPAGDDDDDD